MNQSTAIEVKLLRDAYFPGEAVSGIVSIGKRNPDEHCFLEVYGLEQVDWTESMTFVVQGFAQTYIEKAHGGTKLFQRVLMLPAAESFSPESGTVVPFTFMLPSKLPGTASHHVVYKVKAFVNNSPHAEGIHITEASVPIHVIQECPIGKKYRVKDEGNVRFFLCCNQGKIRSKFVLDRPWYSPGDTVSISAQIGNSTKTEVTGLQVQLSSLKKFISDEGIKKVEEKLVLTEKHEGFEPILSLVLPPDLTSSIFGKNYVFHYLLDVHVTLSRGTGPTLRLPLIVLPKRLDETAVMELPDGPLVSLVLPPLTHQAAFSLKDFRNVEEVDDLARSSSRLSRGWSSIKSLVKSGSKFLNSK